MPLAAVFDHLVVAAATLEQGETYLEQRLGARLQRGGKHHAMGTHNSLLKLGAKRYIEVIAVDPEATAPRRPRWFALDTTALQSALGEKPRLIHWVARSDDIEAARRALPVDPGAAQTLSRGGFKWKITVAEDGGLPGGGVLPSLIQWADARHPADALPDTGVRLVELAGAHPEPALIRSALAALALADTIKITYGAQPRLAAMLQTPRGPVAL
jgi:Glyoxalase-like domain